MFQTRQNARENIDYKSFEPPNLNSFRVTLRLYKQSNTRNFQIVSVKLLKYEGQSKSNEPC